MPCMPPTMHAACHTCPLPHPPPCMPLCHTCPLPAEGCMEVCWGAQRCMEMHRRCTEVCRGAQRAVQRCMEVCFQHYLTPSSTLKLALKWWPVKLKASNSVYLPECLVLTKSLWWAPLNNEISLEIMVDSLITLNTHHCLSLVTIGCP